jgi:hypothetical protein
MEEALEPARQTIKDRELSFLEGWALTLAARPMSIRSVICNAEVGFGRLSILTMR